MNASIIKEYRKKKKLTLQQFSERVGSSLATVKRWEKGSHVPTLIQAAKICKVLSLPFGRLLNDYKEETK